MIRAIISIGFCLWHIALTAQSVDQRALKLRESGNGDRAELALLIDQSTGDWNAYLMAVKSPNDIPEKRIEIWAQLLENFQESQDEIGVLLCADLLSAEYASLRRVGEAKNYCRKCISNAKDLSILIEAECYINLATTYRFNAEYQNALRAADSAIFLAQNNSNNAIYGRSLFSKGSVYQLNNRLDSAMLFYAKSAEVYLQLLDTINLAKTYNNIGIIAEDLGDTKLARKYHSLSLELKLEIGDQNQIASSYIGIGKLYLRLQEWDSASIYFEHAKTVYAQTDNIQGGLWAENNIANAAYYSGDYQKAQRHFKYGLELAIHLKDSTEISRLYANMGWSNISLKQLDDAKSMFDSALFVAQQIESYYALEQAYSGFSDYYIELEDFEKALNFYSKSRDAKDKAMDEKRVEQIATLQTEFSVLEKEKSIAQLAEKNAQAELSLSNQRSWIVGLILALVLIAGGGGIMYLQRQRRVEARLARQELDFRKTMIDATIHAEENERQRIAKDLHDGVVQSLAALKLGVQSAMNAAELESAQKGLFSSHLENIDAAAQEARSISHQMMPRALEEAGLVTALEDMIQKTIGVSDINYSFEHFGFGEQRIDKSIEIGLYRICQELVNNILKHSGANEVFIQLVRTKTHVVLHVEDNGKGFEVKGGKSDGGIGMNNIFSRASAVNGQVSYDSSEPGGTIASIRVPLQELG